MKIDAKAEFIIFSRKQQLNNCKTSKINIAGNNVKAESCMRYLDTFLIRNIQRA